MLSKLPKVEVLPPPKPARFERRSEPKVEPAVADDVVLEPYWIELINLATD